MRTESIPSSQHVNSWLVEMLGEHMLQSVSLVFFSACQVSGSRPAAAMILTMSPAMKSFTP